MDAAAYQRAFDMEQLAILCANYDRLIDSLDVENRKLREFADEAFSMAFNFYHGAGTVEDLRELKAEYRELGIEVDV